MAVSVNRIISDIADRLKFEVCVGHELLDKRTVAAKGVNILGLELIGHLEDFENGKMQVIDKKGLNFLNSMDADQRRERLLTIFLHDIPVIVFTDNNNPDEYFLNLAKENNIPVLKSELPRWGFVIEVESKLNEIMASKIDCRGTMMEVFGIGVLISGKSNVGKSECAIDLIQRGHRLIGDDIVEVSKRGSRVLVAQGKFPISHRMELRGIGIIDVIELYGISAIKNVEKIELIIELEKWNPEKSYERLGIEEKMKEILGVSIPYMVLPVAPGRNTAILIEVAAMNYRLRRRGIVPARELELEVLESCKQSKKEDE